MTLRKTRITTPLVFGLTLLAFQGPVQAGEIQHFSYPSEMLDRAYTYNIYLPDGYDKANGIHYPVVYALHGSGGDEYNWTRKGKKFGGLTHIETELDRLIADKQLQPAMTALNIIPETNHEWKAWNSVVGEALGYMAYHLDYPGDASTRGVDAYNGKHR